jgi:filamentous hemagglutinin family protein
MRANESRRVRVLDRPALTSVLRWRATRLLARRLLVWTLSLVVVLSNWAFLFPDLARAAVTEIIPDEQTVTDVSETTPGQHDVYTETYFPEVKTALNSFSKFNIGSGDTVNLYMPVEAKNLLNLVHSERSVIEGTLNAYRKGHDYDYIDSNVYFLNPHGVLVGEHGVVNVGALSIVTPTTEFMTDFFDDPYTSISRTLAGDVPVDTEGTIDIRGKILARTTEGIKLAAGGVVITGTGELKVDVRDHPEFEDLVNDFGLDENGPIEIVAEESVEVAGSLITQGFETYEDVRVYGGGVIIESHGHITMEPGAVVDASGQDPSGYAGGTVSLTATRRDGGVARISLNSSKLSGKEIFVRAESFIGDGAATGKVEREVGAIVEITSYDPNDANEPWIRAEYGIDISAAVDVSMVVSPETESDDSLDAAYAIAEIGTISRVSVDGYSYLMAGDSISISAENRVTINSDVTPTAGGGEGDHVGGSVAVNKLTMTTEAVVGGDAQLVPEWGLLSVKATSDSNVTTRAVAPSYGAREDMETDPEKQSNMKRYLDQYEDDARTSDEADGAVKVAAALAVNDIKSTTRVALESDADLNAWGLVEVASNATYNSSVTADAGTVQAGSTGVGAAVAINKAESDSKAVVNQDVSSSYGISVASRMNEDLDPYDELPGQTPATMTTLAISGSGSGGVGAAGALAVNVQDTSYVAEMNKSASAGEGYVEIASINLSETTAQARPGESGGSDIGVGASVAISVAANETRAGVAGDTHAIEWGSWPAAFIRAESGHAATTEAEAGVAGATAVAPAVALTAVDNSTLAGVGQKEGVGVLTASMYAGLEISASSREEITTSASGSAAGQDASIVPALALAIVDSSTEATLDRGVEADGIDIRAESYRRINTSSTAGRLGAEKADGQTQPGGVDNQIRKQTSLAQSKKEKLKDGGDDGEGDGGEGGAEKAAPSAETGEGSVSVAAAIGVNLVSATTRASTSDDAMTRISWGGSLNLSSAANTDVSVEADGSTVDGTAAGVGVASAVAINKATSVNEAYLGGTHETPSLMIQAHTRTLNEGQSSEDETNTFSSVAVSGAGAKEVGVAGALALNLTDSKTAALIGGQAYVEMPYSGNVVLSASDKTGDRARATPHETATGETVGVGASVAVNVAVRTTLAELSNGAQITDGWDPAVRGDLTVTAASDHSMETEAIAGASGGVATTAASAVSLSENATTARLGGRPFVDPNEVTYIDGDLIISADSKESVSTLARGSSQGNDLSIGAAVAIALVDSTSQAEADRNVTTHGDAGIAISAQGLNRIDTQAIAGELGGKRKDASTPEDGVDQNIQKQTDLAGKKKAEAKGEAASGGSEEGSGGGRVVFSGGSQDGDQDQGEDEDEDKKEDQDDGQDDDKSDPQDDATGGLDLFRGPRGR